MNLNIRKKDDMIYQAKIVINDSSGNVYYSEKFLNYDDAVDKCNTIYYKLINKHNYKKKIEIIK